MLLTKPLTLQAQQLRGSRKPPLVPAHVPVPIRGDGHKLDQSAQPRQHLPPALLVPALEGKKSVPRDHTSCPCGIHTEREGQARWGFYKGEKGPELSSRDQRWAKENVTGIM